MKNNLVKFVSVGLTSLLTISSCSIPSEVNASTEEPKNFMSIADYNVFNRLLNNKKKLKKLIEKECEALFKEHEELILNKLNDHLGMQFCRFGDYFSVTIRYILDHPELGNVPSWCKDYANRYNFNIRYYTECFEAYKLRCGQLEEIIPIRHQELIKTLQILEVLEVEPVIDRELMEKYTIDKNCLIRIIPILESELALCQKLATLYRYITQYDKIISKKEKIF